MVLFTLVHWFLNHIIFIFEGEGKMKSLNNLRLSTAVVLLCLVLAGSASGSIISDREEFPVTGSNYEWDGSQEPMAFPNATVEIELIALSLNDCDPCIPYNPVPGDQFAVDSFFDVFVELSVDGTPGVLVTDSAVQLTIIGVIPPEYDAVGGTFEAEIVAMELSGDVGGLPILIRENPELVSSGQTSILNLGNGQYQIDSFFDVFTELSIDGGPWTLADGPIRMNGTPEPGTMLLLGLGGLMLRRKR